MSYVKVNDGIHSRTPVLLAWADVKALLRDYTGEMPRWLRRHNVTSISTQAQPISVEIRDNTDEVRGLYTQVGGWKNLSQPSAKLPVTAATPPVQRNPYHRPFF